jgi:hypothetical protein
MRYWSPWDDRLLRALRGEFRINAPILTFTLGSEGGVVVFNGEAELGLWVAASQHTYRYVPADGRSDTSTAPCDIMDIIPVSHTLFADFIDAAARP